MYDYTRVYFKKVIIFVSDNVSDFKFLERKQKGL